MPVLPSEELIKNLQIDPTNPEFHLQYANTWLFHTHETISQLIHSPAVIADLEFHFKEAIRLDPTNGFFKSEYALFLYHVKKEIPSSYVFFEQAIRDSPQNALIRTEYAAILTYDRSKWSLVEELYQQAISIAPKDPQFCYHYASFLHYVIGNLTEAQHILEQGLQQFPLESTLKQELDWVLQDIHKKTHCSQ